jgi:8-oxo-dGTP diphosphatase
MSNIQERILAEFGNKLRVRVCGICIKEQSVLLVKHHALNKSGDFWAPPGGGMEFGTSAEKNLKREFLEETGLQIEIERFLFVHEYLKPPLHAIELIYKVRAVGGKLIRGFDPEMKKNEQIINDVQYISMHQLQNMDKQNVHQMLIDMQSVEEIVNKRGYSRYESNPDLLS